MQRVGSEKKQERRVSQRYEARGTTQLTVHSTGRAQLYMYNPDSFSSGCGERRVMTLQLRVVPSCVLPVFTCRPSGFQRTFLSRAGVELRVFWGLFFSVRMTPHGSSLRALTRFFSCQPTWGAHTPGLPKQLLQTTTHAYTHTCCPRCTRKTKTAEENHHALILSFKNCRCEPPHTGPDTTCLTPHATSADFYIDPVEAWGKWVTLKWR